MYTYTTASSKWERVRKGGNKSERELLCRTVKPRGYAPPADNSWRSVERRRASLCAFVCVICVPMCVYVCVYVQCTLSYAKLPAIPARIKDSFPMIMVHNQKLNYNSSHLENIKSNNTKASMVSYESIMIIK